MSSPWQPESGATPAPPSVPPDADTAWSAQPHPEHPGGSTYGGSSYYPYSTAFPGAGVEPTARHAASQGWSADGPSESGPRLAPTAPDPAEPQPTSGERATRHSGRYRMWFALVAGILAVAVAATVGIFVGYQMATHDAQGATPDLKAVAAQYFDSDADVSGTADALEVTITDSRLLDDLPALRRFLTALGFSDAVLDRMSHTRALDGTLTAQGHHCNVSWTYHPDDGLQMVFEATPGS